MQVVKIAQVAKVGCISQEWVVLVEKAVQGF